MAKINKVTISISPIFWIFAALLGYFMSKSVLGTFIWVIVIFVSVLFHEFGHAILAILFKQTPRIQLIALGGVTSYPGKNLKYYQQFLIVLFGPLFGFVLFLVASLLLKSDFFTNKVILYFLLNMKWANLFWSIINLFPILPMDGGQLLRIVLEKFFGIKGFKYSLLIGFILSAFLALLFFALRSYLAGSIFFLFAFQSFEMYRQSRHMSKADRDVNLEAEIEKAQLLLSQSKKDEAFELLKDILTKTKSGLIFIAASHMLAFIYFDKKEYKKAYDLLLNVKDDIQDDAVSILHRLAFEEENYKLVADLSFKAYSISPNETVALNNARAFGALNDAKASGGWLKSAKGFGKIDLDKTIKEKYFDKVRDSKEFLKYFD